MWSLFILSKVLVGAVICSDENCLDCDAADICYSCAETFFPVSSHCLACTIEPLQCTPVSGNTFNCLYTELGTDVATVQLAASPSTNCVAGSTASCLKCFEGRCLYEDGSCGLCLPPNCAEVDSYGNCVSCKDGFFLNAGNCDACHSSCSKCQWFEYCTGCKSAYTLVGGYCCDPKCSSCNHDKCWGCNGDLLLSDGNCVTCPVTCQSCNYGVCNPVTCLPGCTSCDRSGCNTCQSDFYLSAKVCFACAGLCKTCTDAWVCTSCYSPLVLATSSCCVDGCKTCNYGTCMSCKDTWLWDNYNCVPCPTNCQSCVAGVCTRWICSANCQTCNSAGQCSLCDTGFYLDNYACTACNARCTDCIWAENCGGCKPSYHLVNGYCCDEGCTSCKFETCWACKTGYLFQNNRCAACPSNCGGCPDGVCVEPVVCPQYCSSCLSSTQCSVCNSGYYPHNGLCYKCHPRCTKCNWYEECTECAADYTLILGYCCPAGCTSCNWDKCWGCADRYLYDNVACSACPTNCGGCPGGVCNSPPVCSANCASCLSSTQCTTCNKGYYLSGWSCAQCNTRCTACTWFENCQECAPTYNLILGYCCPAGCSSCNWNKCWGCTDNYLFDGTTCVTCPTTCASCTAGVCNVKVTCPSNCKTCYVSTQCQVCNVGYYLNGFLCSKCNSRCTECTWSETCTRCVAPYNLISGYCCSPSCSSCNWSKCWGCIAGYKLVNGSCLKA